MAKRSQRRTSKTAEHARPKLRWGLWGGADALKPSDWSVSLQVGGVHGGPALFHGGLGCSHHRNHGTGAGTAAAIFKVSFWCSALPPVEETGIRHENYISHNPLVHFLNVVMC